MIQKFCFGFLLLLVTSTCILAQKAPDRNGNLVGFLNKTDFYQEPFRNWFEKEYESYQPKQSILKKIKKELEGVDVKIFMGSWCHDSHREIPRYFKLMETAGFDVNKHTEIIGLTRGKKAPDDLQKGFDIEHTPTFIFYKDGKEIGRYIEHARQTMEKDFLKILKGTSYKHSYEK